MACRPDFVGLSVKGAAAPSVIKLSQRFSDGECDASVVGHREMADATHRDVSHVQVRML